MIHPDMKLAQITTVPAIEEKFSLPGSQDPNNTVSGSQIGVMVRWAKENLPPSATWAQALSEMRTRFLKGNQRDFNIVNAILGNARAENPDRPLTVRSGGQSDMLSTILSALNGVKPHWDAGIQQRILVLSKAHRDALISQALEVNTQGQLQVFMTKFDALCGKPAPKAGLGEPLTVGSSVELPIINHDEEPY